MNTEVLLAKFYHQVRVRFADTDLQGHVFFGNYYTYLDEAFMAYIRELGYSWETLGKMGLEVYYVDSGCQLKGRSFFEDELRVHTTISKIGNSSLTAEMTVVREKNGETVATGFITGVVVDPNTRKPTSVPRELRAAVTRYQDG